METHPNITDFSHELLCQIMKYLPLREILSVAMLCKKMSTAVDMHLRLCKSIDFCQDAICGYMPSTITDDHLLTLLKKCPHLETVYGLHPVKIERRRLRKRSALTIPGIIEALSLCFHLKAIETSDLRLFEAIMQHLPHIEIIGHFQNRDGLFPPQASQRLKLQPYPRISSLHLIGVEVPELTAMPHLKHLHLQCVRFTKLQPFRAFLAQNLKSFVMKHCIGPSVPQRYLSLIIALSSSPNLNHLELVRVPLLNGLFQRAVEDSYRHNGFVNLRTLVISGCKGVLEADLGHLMIVSSKNLETLNIQPSLTKDSLFVSLSYTQCLFPRLQNIHLGYIDTLNSSGEWSNDALLSFGLAEVPDTPSSITDSGMKVISELFPRIKRMSVSNCPHLMVMYHWMSAEDEDAWSRLTDLTLQKCHCLQLSSFAVFIAFLSKIEVVVLNDMFREPPKGCSHVGLSAGTGLGMSSAVVSNQDEHIAVQGHHQDFEHPGEEENEENEREFIDIENEDNQEPHFMVLQRDFFDGEDGADVFIEEGQDAGIIEQEHNEEHNSAENNQSDNNLQSMNESPKEEEDSPFNEDSSKPSTQGNNKSNSVVSNSVVSSDAQSGNANESKYHLRRTSKRSLPATKSVEVQCNFLPPDYQSTNSDIKNIRGRSLDNGEISDNTYKSSDIKTCVMSKDSRCIIDYDPHKPSTSKAGSHLDYSLVSDTKSLGMSDSETDDYGYNKDVKKFKSSSDEQNFSKVVKITEDDLSGTNWTLKSDVKNQYLPKPESVSQHCDITENSPLTSQHHLNNSGSSINEMYKWIKPCTVLLTKLENEPFNKISNGCIPNSDVISEHEEPSSELNKVFKRPSCSSSFSKKEYDIDCDSEIIESSSYQTISPDFRNNSFSNDKMEKLHDSSIFDDSLERENEVSIHRENIYPEIDASVCENWSIYNSSYVDLEKLDMEYCIKMGEKGFKNKKMSKDNSLKDREENSHKNELCSDSSIKVEYEGSLHNSSKPSNQINKNHSAQICFEGTSTRDNYECMETDICGNSVIKIEDQNLHFRGSKKYTVANEDDEFKMSANEINKTEINSSTCTISSDDKVLSYPKNSSNDSFNEVKHKALVIDNCNSCKKSERELSLNEEFHPAEKNSVLEEKLTENEVHVIDVNCDILSVNIGAEQEALAEITTNKNNILSEPTTPVQISKLQNGQLSKNAENENLLNSSKNQRCKISNCESLLTKKQNSSYPEISGGNECTNLTNDICKPVNSEQEHLVISENVPTKTCSRYSMIHDISQPSTSKVGIDCSEGFKEPCKSVGSTKAKRCLTNKRSDSFHTNTVSGNKVEECSTMDIEIMQDHFKVESHTDDTSEIDFEFSHPETEKSFGVQSYDDESKYYVLVSDDPHRSVEIINSFTGESHRTLDCSVVISYLSLSKPCVYSKGKKKIKKYNSSKESLTKQSEMCVEYNPYLPSTSKQNPSDFKTCEKYSTTNANCHKYSTNDRGIEKKYSTRPKKRAKSSSNISDIALKNRNDIKDKNIEFSKTCFCKCCRECPVQSSTISAPSSNVRTERLKIMNSDAAVFIKSLNAEKNKRLNLNVQAKCSAENIDVTCFKNNSYSNQIVKTENEEKSNLTENNFSVYQNDTIASKSDNILCSTEENVDKSISRNAKRTRKKRTSQKQSKRSSKNPLVKSDHSCRSTRSRSKKVPFVPMVSLISQGTQATSADIRRSVRRIRHATAQTRRTVSSLHISRNSTHSNKISAKMLYKRPMNMNPRPECHDKATSTSDPLLEDDAVQVLQLTSETLLSFTVVSCGISDITIDLCPKLFHVEVQACRILKKLNMKLCPAMKRLNISQCPKLSICALASSVMSLELESYFLISYEPCMQGYHPSDGEKAILSKAGLGQSVLLCHDFNDISHEEVQATFREKLIAWFHYLSDMHVILKSRYKALTKKCEITQCCEYPWSYNLRRIHGKYINSQSTDFCVTERRYQLVTNYPIFCDIFETHQLDTGFPAVSDCRSLKDTSLISYEAIQNSLCLENKFIGFYIPITENNQTNF